jgi:hypothetical protein
VLLVAKNLSRLISTTEQYMSCLEWMRPRLYIHQRAPVTHVLTIPFLLYSWSNTLVTGRCNAVVIHMWKHISSSLYSKHLTFSLLHSSAFRWSSICRHFISMLMIYDFPCSKDYFERRQIWHHTSVIHFVDMWSNTFVLHIEKLETPLVIHAAICRF